MLSPGLYIHTASALAPQASPHEAVLCLTAREPDYGGVIAPMQLRRMSKLVRMSIYTAATCLRHAAIARPDAIVMGTAFGCLADTEAFLKKMLQQEEQMLTPTAFIQSTHNTPAGQIALSLGCQGYNNTLSQQGNSFESAVMAAALLLASQPDAAVLCGAGDECTPTLLALLQRLGLTTSEPRILGDDTRGEGVIAGEGVGFFLLGKKEEGAMACIRGLDVFHEASPPRAAMRFQEGLDAGGGLRNTDLLLCGALPDMYAAQGYPDIARAGLCFREQAGAWPTDGAAALAAALQHWPDGKRRIWLLNHWGHDRSLWLLER